MTAPAAAPGSAVGIAAALLRAAGHSVLPADPPYGRTLVLNEAVRWTAGTELDARLLQDHTRLTVPVARHAAPGRAALRVGLPHESGRRRWQKKVEQYFADHDLLLTPALAQPPIEARRWSERVGRERLGRRAVRTVRRAVEPCRLARR